MYKQDYLKYFGNENNEKPKKRIAKSIWKWTKFSLFIFLIFSTLWGCVQMMQSDYVINPITDMAGNKFYTPGVGFEIIFPFLGDKAERIIWTHELNGKIYVYEYKYISNWGEAFSETGYSPYYGFFVYPISFIIVCFIRLFNGVQDNGFMDSDTPRYGVSAFFAIVIAAILIRLLTLSISFKSQMNQGKMSELSIKSAEINEKYKDQTSQAAKLKKQQEIMALYKKSGVNQMSLIASMFISMPFLIAMLSTIRNAHSLKVGQVGAVQLLAIPWAEFTHGELAYLWIVIVYLLLQIVSMFLPQFLERFLTSRTKNLSQAQKKARRKQIIMQVVFVGIFFFVVNTIAAGVAIYWIFSSIFQIIQTIGFFVYREYGRTIKQKKLAKKREKLIKDSKKNNQ